VALDGGRDGLDLYHRLLADARRFLCSGGLVALEIGAGQADAVRYLAEAAFPAARIETYADFAGIPRVIKIEPDARP
jgi:release factor glutamine methyltransferase